MIPSILLSLYVLLLCWAAFTDAVSLRIPNVIAGSVVAVAVLAGICGQQPPGWWLAHLGAGLAVLAAGMALFALGKIGGGDIKLLAGIATWHGFDQLPQLLLVIGIVGGVVTIAFLLMRYWGLGLALAACGIPCRSLESGKGVPYGIAIVAGSLLLIMGGR